MGSGREVVLCHGVREAVPFCGRVGAADSVRVHGGCAMGVVYYASRVSERAMTFDSVVRSLVAMRWHASAVHRVRAWSGYDTSERRGLLRSLGRRNITPTRACVAARLGLGPC
jgi:predicted fused transcriptional regulator/phosphomethylpyrimidine kinase